MVKKKSERPGYGKLLDAWTAPDHAGDPIGCLATSFTFDPVFFEEECLSRFLHLETDAVEDGPAYLIEREEKLSQIRCAAALVDQHHCRGSRNLRWNLLSARVKQAILHAKVSLLVWANQIRLLIASANLTEDGYRRNQEVFGVLDFRAHGDAPLEVMQQAVPFLREALRTSEPRATEPSAVVARCGGLLDLVEKMVSDWNLVDSGSARTALHVFPLFTGPGRSSALEQLRELWPSGTSAKWAHVLSPFFDPQADVNLPAAEIWSLLRKRGEPEVSYYVTVDRSVPGKPPFVHAPESLVHSVPTDRSGGSVHFQELQLEANRPLHAKGIYLNDDRWIAYLMGSGNFTRAGLGLKGPANIEANLVFLADCQADETLGKSLDQAFPSAETLDLESETVQWQPLPNDDESPDSEFADLPNAFGAAIYDRNEQGVSILRLSITGTVTPGWKISTEDDVFVTDEQGWLAAGATADFVVPWEACRPPSGLWVEWDGKPQRAWWPVNVAGISVLPTPEDLRDLPLEVLINILTSARPLHRVLADYLKRRRTSAGVGGGLVLDPHKRVDTSQFLLQRTRRVSAALKALASRLARPVATEESLHWRLRGPVGVEAVAKAILKDAVANDCGAMQSFLIAELALELSQVQPQTAIGALPVRRVKQEITALVGQLRERFGGGTTNVPGNLSQYVEEAFAKATR